MSIEKQLNELKQLFESHKKEAKANQEKQSKDFLQREEQLEKTFNAKLKEQAEELANLKKRNQHIEKKTIAYDEVFEQLLNFPILAARLAQYTHAMEDITKEIARFNAEWASKSHSFNTNKGEDISDLKRKIIILNDEALAVNKKMQMIKKFAIGNWEKNMDAIKKRNRAKK